MRLFVALDIDVEIRHKLERFVDGVRGFAPDVRFVGPESFHITLKFLGETSNVEEIKSSLRNVSKNTAMLFGIPCLCLLP